MKIYYKLAVGIFVAILLGTEIDSSFAAGDGKITITASHKSAIEGVEITLAGKHTDSNGIPVVNSEIILWETDDGKVFEIARTRTNGVGEYRVSLTAKYWDGKGYTVEMYAFSPQGSVKSRIISMNTDKTFLNDKFEHIIPTRLSFHFNTPGDEGLRKIVPKLVHGQFNSQLRGHTVFLYVDDKYIENVESGEWSSIIELKPGKNSIKGVYPETKLGTNTYEGSSVSYTVTWENEPESTCGPGTGLVNGICQVVKSTTSVTPLKPDDILYKDSTYKIKSDYYDVLKKLESGIKLSENLLRAGIFENSSAQEKIDEAWKIRGMAWSNHGKAKDDLKKVEVYLENKNYQKAWEKLQESDKKYGAIIGDITAIKKNISDAKKMEEEYQEINKFCFLFWCNVKNQNQGLELEIKDLELNIEQLENEKQSVKSENRLVDQKIISQQERHQLENEMHQKEFQAEQERLRILEEKRQQEITAQEKLDYEIREKERKQNQILEMQREEKKRLDYENGDWDGDGILNKNDRCIDMAENFNGYQDLDGCPDSQEFREENMKNTIRESAKWSPFMEGIIEGKINYKCKAPDFASPSQQDDIEYICDFIDGKRFRVIPFTRVSSGSYDLDFHFVKNYQPSIASGRQIDDTLIIGLGQDYSSGFSYYSGYDIRKIMWHELGHAMGFAHSEDPHNIMYKKGTFSMETPEEWGWDYDYQFFDDEYISDARRLFR